MKSIELLNKAKIIKNWLEVNEDNDWDASSKTILVI